MMAFGTLKERSVQPAAPVLLTSNGPLKAIHSSLPSTGILQLERN